MDLVELLGRHPAPLRAWIHLAEDLPEDVVPLDEIGLAILGVEPGELVEVRRLAPTALATGAPVAAGQRGRPADVKPGSAQARIRVPDGS